MELRLSALYDRAYVHDHNKTHESFPCAPWICHTGPMAADIASSSRTTAPATAIRESGTIDFNQNFRCRGNRHDTAIVPPARDFLGFVRCRWRPASPGVALHDHVGRA